MLQDVLRKLQSDLDQKYNLSFSFNPVRASKLKSVSALFRKLAAKADEIDLSNKSLKECRDRLEAIQKIKREAGKVFKKYSNPNRALFSQILNPVYRDIIATEAAYRDFIGSFESRRKKIESYLSPVEELLGAKVTPAWIKKFEPLPGKQKLLFFEAASTRPSWRKDLLNLYRRLVSGEVAHGLDFLEMQAVSEYLNRSGKIEEDLHIVLKYEGQQLVLNRLEAAFSCGLLCRDAEFFLFGVPSSFFQFVRKTVQSGKPPSPEEFSVHDHITILVHLKRLPFSEKFISECFGRFAPFLKKAGCEFFREKKGFSIRLLPNFSIREGHLLQDAVLRREVVRFDGRAWEGMDGQFIKQILSYPNLEKAAFLLPREFGAVFSKERNFPSRLKKLSFSLARFDTIDHKFCIPKRISVTLSEHGRVPMRTLIDFIAFLPGLKKFAFAGNANLEDLTVEIAKKCPSCRKLSYGRFVRLSRDYLETVVAKYFPRLKKLEIKNSSQMLDFEGAAALFGRCREIEHLALSSDSPQMPAIMKKIASSLKKLRVLEICGSRFFREQEIPPLIKGCRLLEKMVLVKAGEDPEKIREAARGLCHSFQLYRMRERTEILLNGRIAADSPPSSPTSCKYEEDWTIVDGYEQ